MLVTLGGVYRLVCALLQINGAAQALPSVVLKPAFEAVAMLVRSAVVPPPLPPSLSSSTSLDLSHGQGEEEGEEEGEGEGEGEGGGRDKDRGQVPSSSCPSSPFAHPSSEVRFSPSPLSSLLSSSPPL